MTPKNEIIEQLKLFRLLEAEYATLNDTTDKGELFYYASIFANALEQLTLVEPVGESRMEECLRHYIENSQVQYKFFEERYFEYIKSGDKHNQERCDFWRDRYMWLEDVLKAIQSDPLTLVSPTLSTEE